MLNPYEAPKSAIEPQTKMLLHGRAVAKLIAITLTQAMIVFVAHRFWMENPDVFVNFTSLGVQEKIASSIAYSLVFVFLNCVLLRAIQRGMIPPEMRPSNPSKNFFLTRILAISFAVIAFAKPIVRWQIDTTTFFMLTLSALTILSLYFFQRERRLAQGQEQFLFD